MSTSAARRLNDLALVLLALALSVRAAFSAATLGDYPTDGGPALSALMHLDAHAFATSKPAMGDVSLIVRAPLAALAYLGHASELSIYRWGSLACVLSVAALALWLASIARSRGTSRLGQWAIVAVALVNPLVSSAIELGHPEELLTVSLCIGALVAALADRSLLTLVLLGLALACKQWTVVVVLPVLCALAHARVRVLLGALLTAAVVTLPAVVGAPLSYLHNQLFLVHGAGPTSSVWSWWWPPMSEKTAHVLVEGVNVPVSRRLLPLALAPLIHPLLIGADLLVTAVVACTRRLPLRRDDAFALMALVLLLRCTLDTQTMAYYHFGLLLDVLAWDALAGERLPLRALVVACVSFLLFDRLTPALIGGDASLLYGACTAIAALTLVSVLARRPSRASASIALRPSLPA